MTLPHFCSSQSHNSSWLSETVASLPSGSTPEVFVHAAQPHELRALAEILTESFHQLRRGWRWLYPVLQIGIHEDLRHRLQGNKAHYVCLVARIQDLAAIAPNTLYLAGTVEMMLHSNSLWHQPFESHPYISNLAVRPQYRGQGVARHLLRTCEQIALKWGYRDLYLHVLENNYPARNLYQKVGYHLRQSEPSWTLGWVKKPRKLLLHKPLMSEALQQDC